MELLKNKSSSHWYTKDGEPMHELIGKNGNKRSTNVKDARELGLLPSVTSVLSIIAKPQLELWKVEQALLQSLTLPKQENEAVSDFANRVIDEMEKEKENTLSKGTRIHKALEVCLNQVEIETEEDIRENVICAVKYLFDNCFQGVSEQVLVSEKYAGTCDFIGSTKDHKNIIVDFKSQTIKEKAKYYDEMIMQLAAYRNIVGNNYVCANLIIGTNMPYVEMKIWSEEEIQWGLDCFLSILNTFYKLKKM